MQEIIEEIWKDIPNYEGYYQASNLGRIRSVDREVTYLSGKNKVPRTDFHPSVIKKLRYRKDGYLQVNLCKESNKAYFPVHKIIAEVFLGARPKNLDICHKNGFRDDNRLENLRYDTRVNNFSDSLDHGTRPLGENRHNSKITDDEFLEIYNSKEDNFMLSNRYGVSKNHIARIKRGEQRKHLINSL